MGKSAWIAGGTILTRETLSTRKNLMPVSVFPPQV